MGHKNQSLFVVVVHCDMLPQYCELTVTRFTYNALWQFLPEVFFVIFRCDI